MDREPQPSARLQLSADFRASFERTFDLEADIAAQRLEISRLHGCLRRLEAELQQGRTWLLFLSDKISALEDKTQQFAVRLRSLISIFKDTFGETVARDVVRFTAYGGLTRFIGGDQLLADGFSSFNDQERVSTRAPATKAAAFKAPRTLVEEAGFSRSLDAHADLARRNHLLFEQLCDMHVELSPVLGQIAASRHGEVLRSKLLAKVSDTTAARYFRSVQIFFTTLEELGGDIHNVEAGLLLDTFFSLSRCPEEGPLSNSLNVMKALRWYRKLLDLSPFPDLYSAAFASLVQPASGEKRESLPLPLSFHAFLERKVLDSATPQTEAIWAGSFLACVGGSLRFSDAQHVLWSSLCISHFTLRGICYRTKTTKRGAPFAFLGFGAHSTSREFGENWLSVWILLLDNVWQELRSSFGAQVTPDCFFFTVGKQGFAPASYAQTLLRLRNFLQEAGVAQAEALSYTLHSMKVTMLSWMAQLDLPLPARTLQGHHALAGSMQLYSRDDVWPGPLCAPSFQFGRFFLVTADLFRVMLCPFLGRSVFLITAVRCLGPGSARLITFATVGDAASETTLQGPTVRGAPAWKGDEPAEMPAVTATAETASKTLHFAVRLLRFLLLLALPLVTGHHDPFARLANYSARDPTLSPPIAFAIMSKTPFSADYIHKLLKTIPEAERSKFLEMLETQPILEQQPASASSGTPALAPPPQQAVPTPQSGPAASKAPVPQKQPPPKPSGTPAADPAPAGPPQSHNKVLQVSLNVLLHLLQMPPLPELVPSSTTALAILRFASYNSGRAGRSVAHVKTLSVRRRFQTEATAFTLCTAAGIAKERKAATAPTSQLPLPLMKVGIIPTGSGTLSGTPTLGHPLGAHKMAGKKAGNTGGISTVHFEVPMAAEFFSLMNESSIPDNIREALASYDAPLFARSCNDQDELASLVAHLMEVSDTSSPGDQIMARASVRLLFSRCRESCGLPPLHEAKGSSQPTGSTSPTTSHPAPNAGSSWQESWPAKLSAERTSELRKRFEDDYPTELLDSDSFPSSRLLALTSKMVADKEIRWLPWKFRLSAKAQDDNLLIRPKKLPRLSELSDLLLDEAPSRDIHDGPASFNLINQLLTLATNSIALCRGVGSLKLYQKKFLKLCFTKYESASNLRGPTSLEAQAADKRAWELIGELVNIHAWKLDDALHEVTQVRADLSTLLAPRAHIPKHLFQLKEPWRNRQDGKGNRPHLRGNGKGLKGKHDSSSHAEDAPPERAARGGKGKKGPTSSAGKWLSTLFMEGKQQTLCMRYQPGQCKDTRFSDQRESTEVVQDVPLCVPARPQGTLQPQPAIAARKSSAASLAMSAGDFSFSTCLSLLEEYFSDAAPLESTFPDAAITQADAYFNLGAFGFDDGKRVGIFQRTEQFSDIVRFLNSFLLLRFPGLDITTPELIITSFPGERWVLTAYSCRLCFFSVDGRHELCHACQPPGALRSILA
ncbi:hypothetical protein AK812_SmicGene44615 [Symbiodinium microadriaticum]|uniref:Uncharacterized protein n=1 Tax=Symbiodinium microadriaticum TaxID=2951 RepID=A0A1Q9BY02_SYMMI|nr:hypothetical protein AK812_SmicGene44615 [Symbiodinium microadriaticum]